MIFLKKNYFVIFLILIHFNCLKAKRSIYDILSTQGSNLQILSVTLSNLNAPPTLSYTGSPFSILVGVAMTRISATITGTIASCISSPALPTGLTLESSTCAITGTPTTVQSTSNYNITASNSSGSRTASISIAVTPNNNIATQNIATSWIQRTLPVTSSWKSITFGNGLFVAVAAGTGTTNIAVVSSDGINWSQGTLPGLTTLDWESVAYGNGVFVTVSSNGSAVRAATSPDGINWIARTIPNQNWKSVTFANGTFVAVAGNATSATSTDGIIWVTSFSLFNTVTWNSVAYGNGVFVALADNGNSRSATSTDAINWTTRINLTAPSGWTSVAFGNGVFVGVGSGISRATLSTDNGITWTQSNVNTGTSTNCVTFGNGIFLILRGSVPNPSQLAATSPDGNNWTNVNLPNSQQWQSAAFGNGIFVAVGGYLAPTNIIASSP